MAEEAINKTANKQRDYITFLEQVLDVCLDFKRKADSGHRTIFFRVKGTDHDWYHTQGDGWINGLLSCAYDSFLSRVNALEISRTNDGGAEDVISLDANLRIKPNRTSILEDESLAEKRIQKVLERLQSGFTDSEIIERFRNDSEKLFTIRRLLLNCDSVFDLHRVDIENYLSSYYELLLDLVLFYDTFDQKEDRDVFIGELLRLDAEFDERNDMYHLNFCSPIVLNKLLKANDGISYFYKQITENKAIESEWLQDIYKHIVLIKIQHDFRWYMPGVGQELLHAAIAPYAENRSRDLEFLVDASSLKQYNSYEGVGELRLGEKIIYEYRLIKNKIGSRYCVAIIGDIHAEPIEELYDYVYKKIEKTNEDFLLEFKLYTKNKLDKLNNAHIHHQGNPKEVLLNRDELERVIETNSIVFILDCVELYKSHVPQKETHNFVKHKFAFSKYCEYSAGTKKTDICDRNMLEELYEILTCEQTLNQFGRITKQANGPLLEFCAEKQKSMGMKSTIYVYVSDMKAFENIYHDDQYYIRTERYNQKEIGIIRYSSEKVTKLKVGTKNQMLVFNIWQFIKNVAINERNLFVSCLNESKSAYMDLDRIYIGIDYKDWSNRLEVHYFCEEERFKSVAVNFINNILLPVLNSNNGDMFNQYIRKAMYSFFFSAAKSVNDMLFVHLFMNKADLLGKVTLPSKNDDKKVCDNINIRYKFSSKRFYDMIMRNYDISSNMYVGQIKTSQIIQKNEQRENRIRKDEIYQNVITACKNLLYDDSYLAKNCELELKGRY